MRYYEAERKSYKNWAVVLRDSKKGEVVQELANGFRVRMDAVRWGRERGIAFTSHSNFADETESHGANSCG